MKNLLFLIAIVSLLTCYPKKYEYPNTRKDNTVDNHFGTLVSDPYRWLEDDRSAETEDWVKAQNQDVYYITTDIGKEPEVTGRKSW